VLAALGQGTLPALNPAARAAEATPSTSIEPLDTVMRRHIEAALRATHGRVDGPHGAARLLRINPHTLRARMRKLHVDWRAFRFPSS
jgi:transcriptional regulator with GAF, ATPase, and Fis domain